VRDAGTDEIRVVNEYRETLQAARELLPPQEYEGLWLEFTRLFTDPKHENSEEQILRAVKQRLALLKQGAVVPTNSSGGN
jgi:hypothetical protein